MEGLRKLFWDYFLHLQSKLCKTSAISWPNSDRDKFNLVPIGKSEFKISRKGSDSFFGITSCTKKVNSVKLQKQADMTRFEITSHWFLLEKVKSEFLERGQRAFLGLFPAPTEQTQKKFRDKLIWICSRLIHFSFYWKL